MIVQSKAFISSVWERSVGWLADFSSSLKSQNLYHSTLLLLMAWIGFVYGRSDKGKRIAIEQAGLLQDQSYEEDLDPRMLLVSLEILSKLGHVSPHLEERVAGLMEKVAGLPGEGKSHPIMLQVRHLLAQMELISPPLFEEALEWQIPDPSEWAMNREILSLVTEWLSFATEFGKRDVQECSLPHLLAARALLPGLALGALRAYDLELGGQILRCMRYLNIRDQGYDQGIEFLYLQQRSDGAFGVLNPMVRHLTIRNLELDFLLPSSFVALWTLGEFHSGQALMNLPWRS